MCCLLNRLELIVVSQCAACGLVLCVCVCVCASITVREQYHHAQKGLVDNLGGGDEPEPA